MVKCACSKHLVGRGVLQESGFIHSASKCHFEADIYDVKDKCNRLEAELEYLKRQIKLKGGAIGELQQLRQDVAEARRLYDEAVEINKEISAKSANYQERVKALESQNKELLDRSASRSSFTDDIIDRLNLRKSISIMLGMP